MRALEGIRVLDLSHVIAGPTATHYLALHGAEVIKVETPRGGDVLRHGAGGNLDEGVSISFGALNGGKCSLAIDLKQPRLAAALLELAGSVDVFIENFRPGVAARLGFDYASVRAANERIVYASISGYGQQGAWSTRGAYDHVVQALTGMMLLQGGEGEPPLKVGFPVIDSATGMVAAQAIMAALLRRERTGQGACLDISMVQAALQLMLPHAARVAATGTDGPRVGNRGFTGSPGAQTFRCVDGWISTAANTPRQFRAFCGVLGLDDVPDDQSLVDPSALHGDGFVAAADEARLRARLDGAIGTRSAAGLEADLGAAGVPCARVRTPREFLEDAAAHDLATLPRREVRYPAGRLTDFGAGFSAAGCEPAQWPRAPRLGADTAAILGGLGFSAEDIAALARAGAIRVAGP